MAVLKPRERLVYFRISEDEFRQFTNVCEQAGARSVSDLARNAVQQLITEGQRRGYEDQMEEKIRMLERLILEVTEQLHTLTATSNTVLAGGSGSVVPGEDGFLPETRPTDQNGLKER